MRWLLAFAAIAAIGCPGGGATPAPDKPPADQPRVDPTEALVDLTERGDSIGLLTMFDTPLVYGGLWFAVTPCRIKFGAAGVVPPARREDFAQCLSTTKLVRSDRKSPMADVAVLVHEPGMEIEAAYGGTDGQPTLRWIGYSQRRGLKDALPTITPATLQALANETNAPVAAEHETWLKLCIDIAGAVTSVRPLQTTSVEAQTALVAVVRTWTYEPFILGNQKSPACAVLRFGPPVTAETMPYPVPSDGDAPVIVPPDHLVRIAGSNAIAPDAKTLQMLAAAARSTTLRAVVFLCVAESGTVDSVMRVRPTGVHDYDQKVARDIKSTWKFEPLLADGRPVRACTHAIVFNDPVVELQP